MALEELLEEAVHVLGPDARDILAQIQLYIEEEIYLPENQSPPLGEGFPLTAIRSKARNYRYSYFQPDSFARPTSWGHNGKIHVSGGTEAWRQNP